jgi:hypothetical protein
MHRILVNLEQSATTGLNVLIEMKNYFALANLEQNYDVHNLDDFKQQWRKNYRVWEANRRVFLYPETYIEPDLRDNKSPIFKELEDELLQQKITKDSAEAAYKKYVSQFAELARLRIAGSYYHSDSNTYYFFGCTQQDPPQYYYRKWIDRKVWTPWEKIELGINAPQVSAIIHRGKLYLFWVEANIKEENRVINGSSFFGKYIYDITISYSFLNENNQWISSNKLSTWFSLPPQRNDVDIIDNFMSDIGKEKIVELRSLYEYEANRLAAYEENTSELYKAQRNAVDSALRQLADVQKEEYKEASEKLKEFEKSRKDYNTSRKTFLKCYPSLINNSILLEYVFEDFGSVSKDYRGINVPINSEGINRCLYVSKLDLFQNKLKSDNLHNNSAKQFLKIEFKQIPFRARIAIDILEDWTEGSADLSLYGSGKTAITEDFDAHVFDPDINIVHGSFGTSFILTCGSQDYLISDTIITEQDIEFYNSVGDPDHKRTTTRLSTSKADDLGEILFNDGLQVFLSLETQNLTESPIGIQFINPSELLGPIDNTAHLVFSGAYGEYYKELFFHIPFLIANHLNANQKFKEAKWWYERIFDPTSSEPPNLQHPNDRNWRYIEFRGLGIKKMKEIFTNPAAIATYKDDPFNPHAIARLRFSAYQKAIVMKYIDNLIDWGDYLFAQDSIESINEATMLYILASDILGKRSAKLGKCETVADRLLTYSDIGPKIDRSSEFLIFLENFTQSSTVEVNTSRVQAAIAANSGLSARSLSPASTSDTGAATSTTSYRSSTLVSDAIDSTPISRYQVSAYPSVKQALTDIRNNPNFFEKPTSATTAPNSQLHYPTLLVFCVPPNDALLKYWDRVEDRLFKIRNCMNISGVRRQLALFQPRIDPALLVRAKAAGLSLEDILVMLNAPLPPYRFSLLIEKAKQYTQTVQTFGSALLSALEKKDVEELTLLRSVHERNILELTKKIKEQQIEESQSQYQAIIETKTNVQNRIDYYQGLIEGGLTDWEVTQQISKHIGIGLRSAEGILHLSEAVAALLPDVGSPFAMKYGGTQLSGSWEGWASWSQTMASIANEISSSAGLEATFQRREQEWENQLKLSNQELVQVEQQLLAAEIRQLIAEKDLEIHKKNMEQAGEVHDFYKKDKFTSLGLYNYLSTTLNRLYREAYNVAYDMAKIAERTYEFERDDSTIFIAGDNWQSDRAGLLAGERLILQLQRLEKAYLENHIRDNEITQSFSLALLQPSELIEFRQKGSCEFQIPEIAFDLFYPGQYKRLIKSVRITIPCVTGPYTNVGAKLTLTKGEFRKEASLDTPLEERLFGKNTSISTSSANNDAGLFELNIRDERYLPFEGAGAVSTWKLELLSKFRQFDYNTISDVIIHLSYTAKDDGAFRAKVGEQIDSELSDAAASGLQRLISLKHEFPSAFHQLLHPSGKTQSTEFELTKQYFPYFLADKTLRLVSPVTIYLKPKGKDPVSTTSLTFIVSDTKVKVEVGSWKAFPEDPEDKSEKLQKADISLSGDPIKKWTIDAGTNGLDKEKLDDILILLKYTACPKTN